MTQAVDKATKRPFVLSWVRECMVCKRVALGPSPNGVFVCAACAPPASLAEFSKLYDELGGGD